MGWEAKRQGIASEQRNMSHLSTVERLTCVCGMQCGMMERVGAIQYKEPEYHSQVCSSLVL